MAAPAIVRPWQYRVNRKIFATPTAGVWPPQYLALSLAQNTLYDIKESMKGTGSDWTGLSGAAVASPTGNWTVAFSCDSVTAGAVDDGVDRWAAATNIINNTGVNPRSWIVLNQPGIAPNFQICIEMNASNPSAASFVMSPNAMFGHGGGSAGSTTARPTADDEIVVISAADWGCSSGGSDSSRIHVLKSSDGAATRVIICRNGVVAGFWSFEQPGRANAGWEHPSIAFIVGSSLSRLIVPSPNITAINNTAVVKARSKDYPNGVAFSSYVTVAAGGGSVGLDPVAQLQPNDIDGTTPYYNLDLLSTALAGYGARGRNGSLQDAWMVVQNYTDGSQVPADDSRQFVQAGILAMPWNKTVSNWY